MKTPQEFIIERLQAIKNNIHDISLSYFYDTLTEFHTVEITPFNQGDKVVDEAYFLLKDFEHHYPNTDLIIGGNDNLLTDADKLLYQSHIIYSTAFPKSNLNPVNFDIDNELFVSSFQTFLAA